MPLTEIINKTRQIGNPDGAGGAARGGAVLLTFYVLMKHLIQHNTN